MLLRFVIRLFVITSFLSCSKEHIVKPYGFLNLRVEGQEENIKWETILSQWIDTAGTIDLDATSYYFDRCNIHLKNITSPGAITPSLMQFYYTDGLDFQPYAVTGTLTITEANDKAVRGTFALYFANNYN